MGQIKAGPCVFRNIEDRRVTLIVYVHVDDLVVASC